MTGPGDEDEEKEFENSGEAFESDVDDIYGLDDEEEDEEDEDTLDEED